MNSDFSEKVKQSYTKPSESERINLSRRFFIW